LCRCRVQRGSEEEELRIRGAEEQRSRGAEEQRYSRGGGADVLSRCRGSAKEIVQVQQNMCKGSEVQWYRGGQSVYRAGIEGAGAEVHQR
jgi:hypothetical protein